MALLRERKSLLLEFRGLVDGYEIYFQKMPVAILRMRRRSIEGDDLSDLNEIADLASGESSDGQWLFETRDVRDEIKVLRYKDGSELGRFKRGGPEGRSIGEIRFGKSTYEWRLVEADPNQIVALVRDGKSILKFSSENNLERGRIEIEDIDFTLSEHFSAVLLFSLYLYLRPVPGAKAAVPSR